MEQNFGRLKEAVKFELLSLFSSPINFLEGGGGNRLQTLASANLV